MFAIAFLPLALIALFLGLTGCGTAPDHQATAPAPVGSVESAPVEAVRSIALATLADLPACTEANDRALAYVMESRQFLTCQGGAWVEIDVRGADGKDGAAGKDGLDGNDGHDGRPVPLNTWIDPITGRVWLIGGMGPYDSACTAPGVRLPTSAEGFEAVEHGLFSAVPPGGFSAFWVDGRAVIDSAHAFTTVQPNRGTVCIKV